MVPKELKKKRGGDNGKRKPIIDDQGLKWCNCTVPKLSSTMGIGPGSAYCRKCHCNWYN